MTFIGDGLETFADRFPDRAALKCGAVSVSWPELLGKVSAAEEILRSSTGKGARIALRLKDPVPLLVWFLACARTARVAMVLDPDWPDPQAEAVLAETAPDLEITAASPVRLVPEERKARPPRCRPDRERPGADDLFYAGFTSGTTGTPKGYVRSHGSWLHSFSLSDKEFAAPDADCVVLPGRLTHSLHLYGAVYGLCRGLTVAIAPRFDPRRVLSDLDSAETGSILFATPTQLHFLAEAARRGGGGQKVRQVLASGAKWQAGDRKRLSMVFPQARLFEFYGASETSFIAVSGPEDPVPPGSVGRAASGVELVIGAPGAPNAPGVPGPIWVKSGLLFAGYLCGEAPDTRWNGAWLTFGDRGYLDPDGFLFLTGRESRMIVTSGLNIYPEEVEAVLLDVPEVAVAVAGGLPDAVRGQRLEAVVQLAGPLPDAEAALLRHCREKLPAGKVPRKIHVKEHLPLSPGGKPDIRTIMEALRGDAGESLS
ncbi:AMP-binding protein [Roseibium aggregatum]|uniref:AMP-binding protein n=1 Tax=Roseibium aggregatum TaxID=187304 RepID=A0A939EHB4_9HYPH|nr:AMP-binding protein [Roseibium aggregatum]MBN9673024.1 AMP-binding protein [Roseibium aggregatum]